MSRSKNTYIMTPTILKRLKNSGKTLECRRCGEKITTGDRVVSLQAQGSRYNHYIYHEECYEEMLI